MEPIPPPVVFISHSSSDGDLASQICVALESQKIHCLIAPRDMTFGSSYAESIVHCIESCNAFLLLASPIAMASNQVLSEVEQAHKRRIPIYTIMISRSPVPRELDFYISRLHWLEHAGPDVHDLAAKLVRVFTGQKKWPEVATPPSFWRSLKHVSGKLFWSAMASTLVLAMAVLVVWFWISRQTDALHRDYRSLGWVTLAAERPASATAPIDIETQVWLAAETVRFGNLTLTEVSKNEAGTAAILNLTNHLNSDQIGPVQTLHFPTAQTTKEIVICLAVPSSRLHKRYRVTQAFSMRMSTGGITADTPVLAPIAEPVVIEESGAPCGATP